MCNFSWSPARKTPSFDTTSYSLHVDYLYQSLACMVENVLQISEQGSVLMGSDIRGSTVLQFLI